MFIIIFFSLTFFLSHFFLHKIIFKENEEYDKESVEMCIKKRAGKVKICIFSIAILFNYAGDALQMKRVELFGCQWRVGFTCNMATWFLTHHSQIKSYVSEGDIFCPFSCSFLFNDL